MLLSGERKILTVDNCIEKLAERGGKKLVHCHGCYDFLHPGHLYHFAFAKTFGDWLLVSLNADAYFSNKGPGRPFFNERLRAITVASLEVVDFVCIYPGFIPEKIFEKIRPEVYIKGIEYDYRRGNPKIPEEEMVAKYGGRVVYGPEENIYSSTKLIRALQACRIERED